MPRPLDFKTRPGFSLIGLLAEIAIPWRVRRADAAYECYRLVLAAAEPS